jgi:transposase-like protein
VAQQLGYGVESVRLWVKQADIDEGRAPGVTTAEANRIRDLEQEVRELRRANEILKRGGCRTDESAARSQPLCGERIGAGSVPSGQPVDLQQVVGGADQLPFAVYGGQAAA